MLYLSGLVMYHMKFYTHKRHYHDFELNDVVNRAFSGQREWVCVCPLSPHGEERTLSWISDFEFYDDKMYFVFRILVTT